MIVHAVNISAPALAWDRDAIKVSVNAVDGVMDCETEEEVIWPGSDESQEHEDEDEKGSQKTSTTITDNSLTGRIGLLHNSFLY